MRKNEIKKTKETNFIIPCASKKTSKLKKIVFEKYTKTKIKSIQIVQNGKQVWKRDEKCCKI